METDKLKTFAFPLSEELHRAVKIAAAQEGIPMIAFVRAALEKRISECGVSKKQQHKRVKLDSDN